MYVYVPEIDALLSALVMFVEPLILMLLVTGHFSYPLALKVLVTTIDAQWEGMGDVGSARYEPAFLPPCPTIRVLSYSN